MRHRVSTDAHTSNSLVRTLNSEDRPIAALAGSTPAAANVNRGFNRLGTGQRGKKISDPQREVRVRMNIYDLKSVMVAQHQFTIDFFIEVRASRTTTTTPTLPEVQSAAATPLAPPATLPAAPSPPASRVPPDTSIMLIMPEMPGSPHSPYPWCSHP